MDGFCEFIGGRWALKYSRVNGWIVIKTMFKGATTWVDVNGRVRLFVLG